MKVCYKIEDIQEVAHALAATLAPNDVLGFTGDLGAGKTTFIKHIASYFGIDPSEVTSPTYVYHHIYKGTLDVHHMDLYRIEQEQTLLQLDLLDYIHRDGIALVEWVDKFSHAFHPFLHLHIETVDETTRNITITNRGWSPDKIQKIKKAFSI